ncbi:MAG TPA: phage BR0599 family protein [Gemmatimonadaceae bacterium]|nr:phage BR0599 family protein [Gemmatimonadaceae bacterium]
MSFLSLEQAGGKPVELFVFQQGTNYWRYTDGQAPVTVNDLTYQPAVIARGEQSDSQERAQATITVTLDRALPVVRGMLFGSPFYRVSTVAVFRFQPGATDKALIGRGQISGVRFRGTTVEVTISHAASLLQRPVPRLTYLPTCNLMTYDAYCGIDPAAFTFNGTVASVLAQNDPLGSPDGPSVTVTTSGAPSEFATAGYFTAGFFTFQGQPTFLIAHTVASGVALLVALAAIPAGVAPGTVLAFTAGDDHSYETCLQKFNNLAHFLGFPFMPTKDPFTQGLR